MALVQFLLKHPLWSADAQTEIWVTLGELLQPHGRT